MNEYLTWQTAQVIFSCAIFGVSLGVGTYEAQYYRAPYQESSYRATTYTGKGMFKCQTNCPQQIWTNN